jgi:hypothetical protein
MPVKKLTVAQKEAIVTVYQSKTRTITQIAGFLGVSARTVSRVLEEKGIAGPMAVRSAQASQVMEVFKRRGIDPVHLELILDAPALTPDNVVTFLKQSNAQQLVIILGAAGLLPAMPVPTMVMPTKPIPKTAQTSLELRVCHAGQDGECNNHKCPQLRDKEPQLSGRHCPLDNQEQEAA